MKVLHISLNDVGGAGKAALRLHLGLKSIGIESKMLVMRKRSLENDVIEFSLPNGILHLVANKLFDKFVMSQFNIYRRTRPKGLDAFSDNRTAYSVEKHPLMAEADIINLHGISYMVNYKSFFPELGNKPIVWTLHDMNPFTGGCHYSGDCRKYETGCGACPQLGSKDPNDLSRRIFKRKEKSYQNRKIYVMANSRWLADCARKSQLFKDFKVDFIHYCLQTYVFRKRDRNFSRELLNLPKDGIIILFGADYLTERKGIRYLLEAISLLEGGKDARKMVLVTFGSKLELVDTLKDFKPPLLQYGYINNEALLSIFYSAADVFIIPSLEECLGQTCLESMSCQTPCIGFNVGGIPELIKHRETGLLVEAKNAGGLAEQIEWMITHLAERDRMGKSARDLVEQEHTPEIQARRYFRLYESILYK